MRKTFEKAGESICIPGIATHCADKSQKWGSLQMCPAVYVADPWWSRCRQLANHHTCILPGSQKIAVDLSKPVPVELRRQCGLMITGISLRSGASRAGCSCNILHKTRDAQDSQEELSMPNHLSCGTDDLPGFWIPLISRQRIHAAGKVGLVATRREYKYLGLHHLHNIQQQK
jgi:hypothetical protein